MARIININIHPKSAITHPALVSVELIPAQINRLNIKYVIFSFLFLALRKRYIEIGYANIRYVASRLGFEKKPLALSANVFVFI